MSTTVSAPTLPPPILPSQDSPTPTDVAIARANGAATLLKNLETANPALLDQIVGSPQNYATSAAGVMVGATLSFAAAQWGLSCSAGQINCLTPETIQIIAGVITMLGSGVSALAMHWIGKIPGRALKASQ